MDCPNRGVDTALTYHTRSVAHGIHGVCLHDQYTPFRDYYQIDADEQSAHASSEPRKDGELSGRYEPAHSPFDSIWQIVSETGWSVRYILWGVNIQTLIMMMSDAPRYNDKPKKKRRASLKDFIQSKAQAFQ